MHDLVTLGRVIWVIDTIRTRLHVRAHTRADCSREPTHECGAREFSHSAFAVLLRLNGCETTAAKVGSFSAKIRGRGISEMGSRSSLLILLLFAGRNSRAGGMTFAVVCVRNTETISILPISMKRERGRKREKAKRNNDDDVCLSAKRRSYRQPANGTRL